MNFARVMDAAFERGELTTVKDAELRLRKARSWRPVDLHQCARHPMCDGGVSRVETHLTASA
jgi:hypothetical protein